MENIIQNQELLSEMENECFSAAYPTGSKILGKDLHAMPLLKKGTVKISQSDSQGNSSFLYYVQANESRGLSILSGLEQSDAESLDAIVEEDAEILFVPLARAKEWFVKYPEWTEFIIDSYNQKFHDVIRELKSVTEEKLETRVLKYLRKRKVLSGESMLPITHQNLADDMSTNRVVISRLLKSLEKKGILKLGRNKIFMTDNA